MQPLGAVKTVTTAGTPVQISTTEIRCTKIWIQPMRSLSALATGPAQNTGTIYLKTGTTAKGASSTDIVVALDSGQNAILLEAQQRNGWDLSKLYMDADNNGDGALISYA